VRRYLRRSRAPQRSGRGDRGGSGGTPQRRRLRAKSDRLTAEQALVDVKLGMSK
jgi:hypothetical protein